MSCLHVASVETIQVEEKRDRGVGFQLASVMIVSMHTMHEPAKPLLLSFLLHQL